MSTHLNWKIEEVEGRKIATHNEPHANGKARTIDYTDALLESWGLSLKELSTWITECSGTVKIVVRKKKIAVEGESLGSHKFKLVFEDTNDAREILGLL